MDLISRETVKKRILDLLIPQDVDDIPSAFEGMTNGEVFETIFPNCVDYKGCIEVKTRLDMGKTFRRTWWDRPYDKEWEL